ncbi:hypothetical protein DVH05_007839 [Phytophthora capsici]|nr:hypothetical protein DVH05_007839 [Phytophthora capsici]
MALGPPTPPATRLQATGRSGMEPSELAELSRTLGKRSDRTNMVVSLSKTARRRVKLDAMIDNINKDLQSDQNLSIQSNNFLAMLMAMEERRKAQEAQYRRERDEREWSNQQMMMTRIISGSDSALNSSNEEESESKGDVE